MGQEGKPSEPESPTDAPADAAPPDKPGAETPASLSADAEKDAQVEAAKARVVAAREAAQKSAAAPPPKPPVKKKEEGPKPVDASGHPLVQRLRAKLEGAVEAAEFAGQLSIRVEGAEAFLTCRALREDSETPFDYLSDLTCVHYPDNRAAPFEAVYILYSIATNERVRVKVATTADGIDSVTSIWPAAEWPEREVYDLFGVRFLNHPDLRRILLPPDWEGHPLRKDYPLEFIENRWTENHLPVFTEVQREQVDQRRTYGLEMLSIPQEREVRKLFCAGKEVMPKDK